MTLKLNLDAACSPGGIDRSLVRHSDERSAGLLAEACCMWNVFALFCRSFDVGAICKSEKRPPQKSLTGPASWQLVTEERTFSERIIFAPGMKTDPKCVMLNISHDPLGTATR